ncbi:protein XNDC1N [Discoglossus pictus]
MAPIKILHIVSFTSQDPKHPVENLLSESSVQPWLISPQDRSRLMKVELQLERACLIGYIDIGNSGSAFLQIDVGRSTWALDKPFVTIVATTTLMTPVDSKLGKNRNGVRMFKKGDFLADAEGEKWDRLRITCSQPFNKLLFGLAFLRLRSPSSDEEDMKTSTSVLCQNEGSSVDSTGSPPLVSMAFRDMFIERTKDNNAQSQVQEKKNDKLHQVLLGSSPRIQRTALLSRTARMVMSVTELRKRRFQETVSSPSPPHNMSEKSRKTDEQRRCQSPVSSNSCPKTSMTPPTPDQKECTKPSGRRRLRMQGPSGSNRRQPRLQVTPRNERESILRTDRSPETALGCSSCPICGGYFRVDYLTTHASTCGEDNSPQILCLSSDDDSSSDEDILSVVPCPLCGIRFLSTEVERHASTCGE